jgi:hypothetical protein
MFKVPETFNIRTTSRTLTRRKEGNVLNVVYTRSLRPTSSIRRYSSRFSRRNVLHLVRFEVFTAVTMKNGIFWDIKTPVRTSQGTYYVSATESSRLMLCKI